MASTGGFKEKDRVRFKILGNEVMMTGTICNFAPYDQVTVHPDGYTDKFTVMVPQASLQPLSQEESGDDDNTNLPSFARPPQMQEPKRKHQRFIFGT